MYHNNIIMLYHILYILRESYRICTCTCIIIHVHSTCVNFFECNIKSCGGQSVNMCMHVHVYILYLHYVHVEHCVSTDTECEVAKICGYMYTDLLVQLYLHVHVVTRKLPCTF